MPSSQGRVSCYSDTMKADDFHIIHLDSVDSTNTYLARRLNELPHHAVVVSDIQLRGRGRLERSWDSSHRGNLYMSLLEKNVGDRENRLTANFTQYMALCAVRTCRDMGFEAGIKWPNDIFLGGGKLGGILSESRLRAGADGRSIIIGMGVNLHDAPRLHPASRYKAVSLAGLSGNAGVSARRSGLGRDGFLLAVLDNYAREYEGFLSGGFPSIAGEFEAVLLNRDRVLRIEADGFSEDYSYAGLSSSGELMVVDSWGDVKTLVSGDVEWMP